MMRRINDVTNLCDNLSAAFDFFFPMVSQTSMQLFKYQNPDRRTDTTKIMQVKQKMLGGAVTHYHIHSLRRLMMGAVDMTVLWHHAHYCQ